MSLRVGTIGLGLMGTRLLESLQRHESFTIVCGHDLDARRCAAAAARFGLEIEARAEALLAREDLDLIYVATPPASHLALARGALERGHALLVEKPLAVEPEDAQRFVEWAEGRAARAAVDFPFATLPGLRRFERELASGQAGAPVRVEIALHFSHWPRSWHKAGDWLAGRSEGGFLREVFSHFAYLTGRLLEPLSVRRASLEFGGASESRVEAELVAGALPVSLIGAVGGAAPDSNRWTLYCERRSYRVEDWSRVRVSDGARWYDAIPEEGESFGLEAQLDELAKLVRGEAHALASLRDGLDVLRVVEQLHALGAQR